MFNRYEFSPFSILAIRTLLCEPMCNSHAQLMLIICRAADILPFAKNGEMQQLKTIRKRPKIYEIGILGWMNVRVCVCVNELCVCAKNKFVRKIVNSHLV